MFFVICFIKQKNNVKKNQSFLMIATVKDIL